MKIRNYRQLLEYRGYHCKVYNKYAGEDIYIKTHTDNVVHCKVRKDSHGKAQTIMFIIESTKPTDIEKLKLVEFDRSYLVTEILKIHEAFKTLKDMKSPKHIYF